MAREYFDDDDDDDDDDDEDFVDDSTGSTLESVVGCATRVPEDIIGLIRSSSAQHTVRRC